MSRDSNTDLLKAAAIFGVVFIHTPGDTAGLANAFRFCVPAFVVLWAVYFEAGLAKRPAGTHWAYVRSRLARLAVPYLVWTGIYLRLFHPVARDWTSTPLHTIAAGWLGGYGWPGQYFLVILFQLTVLVPLIRRHIGRRAAVAVMFAGVPLYAAAELSLWRSAVVSGVGDRLFIYWLPYVALGVSFVRGYIPRPPSLIAITVATILLALAPFEYRQMCARVPRPSPYLLLSVYVGSIALAVALAPCPVPRVADRAATPAAAGGPSLGPLGRVVQYVGRNTFPIFLANPLVIYFIPVAVTQALDGGLLGELQHVGLTVAVIGACLVLGWAVQRSGLGLLVGT
jgi:fucose 4-O-acetylase-like acetyltransferase